LTVSVAKSFATQKAVMNGVRQFDSSDILLTTGVVISSEIAHMKRADRG
jgi:hypothetical protein